MRMNYQGIGGFSVHNDSDSPDDKSTTTGAYNAPERTGSVTPSQTLWKPPTRCRIEAG